MAMAMVMVMMMMTGEMDTSGKTAVTREGVASNGIKLAKGYRLVLEMTSAV